MEPPSRRSYEFPPSELAGLVRLAERDVPGFADVLELYQFTTEEVLQPFFPRAVVLELSGKRAATPKRIHVGWLKEVRRFWVLTRQLYNLRAMAKADPPRGLADLDVATAYALDATEWTAESDELEAEVSSMPEEPRVGPREVMAVNADHVIHYWLLRGRELIERRLTVHPDGALDRIDRVVMHVEVARGSS